MGMGFVEISVDGEGEWSDVAVAVNADVALTHRGGSDHEDVEEDDDAAGRHRQASEEIRSEGDGQVAVTMLCLCHVSMGTGATSAQL